MKLEGKGILKSEGGDTIAKVSYSITPGRRPQETAGEAGPAPVLRDKTGLDAVQLVSEKELSADSIPTYAILEAEGGRRFRLVITSTVVPPLRILEATGTEIED